MPSLRTRHNQPLQFKEDSDSDDLSSPPSDAESEPENDYKDAKTPRNKRNGKTKPAPQKKHQDSKPTMTTKEETEEDIYALPLGTSDEEEGSDAGQSDGLEDFTPRTRRIRGPGQTLKEKLAGKDDMKKDLKSPSSSLKRTSQDMLGGDDTSEQIFGVWSQRSGKRQSQGYGSKFRKTPSSSMLDSQPPSSAPPPKSSATSVEEKGEDSGNEEVDKGPVFQVPREIDPHAVFDGELPEIADSEDDGDSPLSSAVSYDSSDMPIDNKGDAKDREFNPLDYVCPLCKEPVDRGQLLVFQAQPRQRFRDQRKFCESHKQGSAEREWEDKGYPKINWDKFEQRIEAHYPDLERLMVPYKESYYRNVLNEAIKHKKAKNFRPTLDGDWLETVSCGYYGTRGSEFMYVLDLLLAPCYHELTVPGYKQ